MYVRKIQISLKSDRNSGTVHKVQYNHISLNFSQNYKCFRQNCKKKSKHILQSVIFLENRDIYQIMRKSIVDPGRPQIPIWRMRIACSIPKATNTHSQYVFHIDFPLQQWKHERASLLRHTYILCKVIIGMERFYCAVENQFLNVIPIYFSL